MDENDWMKNEWITGCPVAPACVNGDWLYQCDLQPHPLNQYTLTKCQKIWHRCLCQRPLSYDKFGSNPFTEGLWESRWNITTKSFILFWKLIFGQSSPHSHCSVTGSQDSMVAACLSLSDHCMTSLRDDPRSRRARHWQSTHPPQCDLRRHHSGSVHVSWKNTVYHAECSCTHRAASCCKSWLIICEVYSACCACCG